ncbi:hypothetical protein DPMN_122869 [Dreissena polymorpha]|uniref:Uncharacterized protein n=1 Tax=Dreissena polymorpha TaxID=45954 RepID=A0A9D4GQ76_DREPO|nr:hypothetical protein DPMN_122869 [Dreissena polymorpha]
MQRTSSVDVNSWIETSIDGRSDEVLWMQTNGPKTLLDALNACGSGYPLMQLILTCLLTVPATSASCERPL